MLDIKLIREQPALIEELLRRKDPSLSLALLLETDELIRKMKTEAESLKSSRNTLSKEIGELKRLKKDSTTLMEEVATISERTHALDAELKGLEENFTTLLASLPNTPAEDVKVALDPKENVCVKMHGEKPSFSFAPKNHLEIGAINSLFDFPRGAKISGSGFPVYKGMGARLEWALIQYMIDTHVKNGFEQMMVPHLVKPEVMYGVGQLPKFENQLFKIKDEDFHLYLIPTAEAAICGLHQDEILESADLPRKYVSYTPCFRREAGAAGSAERGLIRTHQFNKVEMFVFCKPEESWHFFDKMVESAESILNGLGIHYRRMLLVTGDMSFAANKTIDIEVWLPGQNRYYEVSSVSNCTDYQSRRGKIRYREGVEGKPHFVHTLNGSGLATSRLMVAILENFQQEDGSFVIPHALHPYLHR